MPSIRTTKTASGATAVQIVSYRHGETIVHKHVGSAKNTKELERLFERAEANLPKYTGQARLFLDKKSPLPDRAQYLGATYVFTREFLRACAVACGLDALDEPLLLDLAVMRLIEPASKLRTLELLKRYFGVVYVRRTLHRALPLFVKRKAEIERLAFSCAKNTLRDSFALVLYDVTTLYFETFKADELRVQGFSKDDKSKQPQIVIGLLVTASGFPVAWEVFRGNTFEGHTMLPVLKHFADTNRVSLPVVVADAAMLSKTNTEALCSEGISYIVGARLANTSPAFIQNASNELNHMDKKTVRLTYRGETIVCSFSEARYRKDRHEMEKQIARAKKLVVRQESGRRAKFVKKTTANSVAFDETLQKKAELLLGIKGYVTNIPEKKLSNANVISFYHNLWQVEQSFRMSKHDLETRPIFHRTEDAIRAHILICFVALMMGKYLEINTGLSIRHIRDLLWSVTEARIKDTVTDEVFTFKSPMDEIIHSPLGKMMKKLGFTY